ncbi:hypothetical protein [Actinosynnema sp. NPDC023587]|uniref:hypothetical protein n=1 Tax=Actinosynnema sp. NPDC023587 TaxID=3154695 RepID=UPI0033FBA5E5
MERGVRTGRLIAEFAAGIAELVANARRERLQAAGEDTAWREQVLREWEAQAVQAHDKEIFSAIRAVFERHGGSKF